ncbi:MAG TPA: GNAT family N-acetyltransferase [Sphingobacteriaceae bacterium]
MEKIEIICLTGLEPALVDELAGILVPVVDGGASIGFLAPLSLDEAKSYWLSVPGPDTRIFLARINGKIAGTVQLHLCIKPNGLHRAEVCKLMVHPDLRRNGVARALMVSLEVTARAEGRTLLVLDTREGDHSNILYRSLGYTQAGRIPNFARSSEGGLDATVLYYKEL